MKRDKPIVRPGVDGSFSTSNGRWGGTVRSVVNAEGWEIQGNLRFDGDRVVLDQLTLHPPAGGATMLDMSAQLRSMQMGAVQREWEWLLLQSPISAEFPDEVRRSMLTANRPGRRGHPEHHYARWAARYVAACEDSPHPVQQLVAEYPGETTESINRYVRKAEALGFITERPGRGKAGGRLTSKAHEVLGAI
jgi:hypothetical protein